MRTKLTKNAFLAAFMLASVFTTAAAQTPWDGTADTTWYTNNKEATEFTITTPQQLSGLARLVNGAAVTINNGAYNMSGKTIKLGANIVLNSNTSNWQNWGTTPPAHSWTVIGRYGDQSPFQGTFDGNGYTISGVYINNTSSTTYISCLFCYVGEEGTIKNLGVIDSYIKGGGNYIGGLVGYNKGTVSNSYFIGEITGTGHYVGGLVGSGGTVSNSYAIGAVTGIEAVGGLVGAGTVSNSYATGTVSGSHYVGGLVGVSYGTVSNSYATGAVSGSHYVGGLVGAGTVSNSYATGAVTGNEYVGGLVGRSVTVSNSYATGTVSGSRYVGGLVGENIGTIIYSYYNTQTSGQIDIGKGEGKTTAEMQSNEFVNILNVNATILSMNGWIYSAGKYPALSNTQANTIGEGTETNPYIITTKEQLEYLSILVNLGKDFNGEYFKLGNNIALNGTETNSWTAIGNNTNQFKGIFDGNGHTISGVYINSTSDYQGLFGYLGSGGIIKNLGIVSSNINGGQYIGGLVGYNNSGIVSNSYYTGTVTGSQYIGGLIGYNNGIVSNNYSAGDVTGTGNNVGGLVGYNNSGIVSNSYYTGTVTGSQYIGGLVGYNNGTVSNDYSAGDVTGTGNNVGGLVGYNTGSSAVISNSYSTGSVEGNSNVGGLVGYNISSGTVSNNYSTGTVTGTSDYVGGLVGRNSATVSNSYSAGAVTGSGNIGGLVGGNSGTVSNSYYDSQISGRTDIGKGEGKTTVEMQSNEFANILNVRAAVLSKNSWLHSAGKYPTISNTLAITSYFANGIGTEANPYIINTKQELENLSLLVNLGKNFNGEYSKLGNNIALNGTADNPWNVIGISSSVNFQGTFDGNGYAISGLYINNADNYQGLFGYLGANGVIKNLGVVDSYVKGGSYVGGLVGYVSNGVINNSYSTSTVTGSSYVGGLVGYISNYTVSNSYSTGAVTGSSNVGGLVGYISSSTVSNSYATGMITGNSNVGGLVGYNNSGTISNSYYDKTTSGRTDTGKGTGKVTEEMKEIAAYAGWDFLTIWKINSAINNGYPYLFLVKVNDILNEPSNAKYNETLTLTGTVTPANTNSNIVWSVVSGNAVISDGNKITFNSAGSVEIKATIINGISNGVNFEKNFIIEVGKADGIGVVSINGWTYGNEPNVPISTNGAGAVSYMYKVQGTDDATYSVTVPTNAGNYTVRATFAESDNYLSNISTADFAIAKAHHDISHIELKDHTVEHTGDEHCHVGHIGELPAGVTVVFEDNHHCQSEEGSHKVKLTFVNTDPNYHDFDESHHLEALLNIVANTPIISAKPATVGIIAQTIGKDIVLSNLPSNAKVEVFGLNGKRVYVGNSANSKILRILIQTKGMYIVRVGGQSLKVAVR